MSNSSDKRRVVPRLCLKVSTIPAMTLHQSEYTGTLKPSSLTMWVQLYHLKLLLNKSLLWDSSRKCPHLPCLTQRSMTIYPTAMQDILSSVEILPDLIRVVSNSSAYLESRCPALPSNSMTFRPTAIENILSSAEILPNLLSINSIGAFSTTRNPIRILGPIALAILVTIAPAIVVLVGASRVARSIVRGVIEVLGG